MKKVFIAGMLGLLVMASCGKSGERKHSHDGHDHGVEATEHNHSHEGHDHEAEHKHSHDGHDHGAEATEHDHAHEGHNHEAEVAGHGASASDEIVVTPEKARQAGIVVETVQPATFREVITTSGQIQPAQGDEVTLVANVSGVVSFSRPVAEGMAVKKNTAVFSISSAHLQDGDPVERARIAYETAKAEYERAEKLVESRIVSQKDFNAIRENYENARLTYEVLRPDEGGKGVAVRAVDDGYVKNCLVKEGDYVSMGQPLMTLIQSRRLYLKADVPERHYAQLSRIASANFRTSYDDSVYRLDDLNGRLLSYGKASNDASFYIPVTFEFDNKVDVLPGSFAEVFLLTDEREGVITLPVSALTEEQGVNFIYLQLDEECYKKQEVKLGATNGDRIEIKSGLHGGERVVTQGAIYVKLASASNAIPAHTHNH